MRTMTQKKLKILFRTYGGKVKNKQTGLGHIFRCINLSYHLKQHGEIHFLVEDYGGVKKILNQYGFKKFSPLEKNISLASDIKQTIQYINENKIDVLIIDKHKTNTKYLKELKNFVKTVIISDLKNVELPVDILVNGYVGLKNRKYKNKYNSLCLVGPSYQILNHKFSNHLKRNRKKYDILVTFGGLDEKGISDIFLDSLNEYVPKLKIKIILGPIAEKSKKVSEFSKKYSKNIEFIQETKDMHKEISNSKFGFTTGGVTTYEFASMNVPFAVICDDLHQIPTAREWAKKNVALNLGLLNSRTSKKIKKVIVDIAENKINYISNTSVVDGLGAKRVSSEILKSLSFK